MQWSHSHVFCAKNGFLVRIRRDFPYATFLFETELDTTAVLEAVTGY